MLRKLQSLLFIFNLVVMGGVAVKLSTPVYAWDNCSEWRGKLGASVNGRTGEGIMENNSDCTFTVTLQSYKAYQYLSGDLQYLYTQELYDTRTAVIGPWQKNFRLQVRVPDCLHQVDFFRGNGYTQFTPQNYNDVVRDNTAADFPQDMPLCQRVTPTPTSMPQPTATPTSVPTATPMVLEQQAQQAMPYPTQQVLGTTKGGQPVYSSPQIQQTPQTGAGALTLLSFIPTALAGFVLRRKL